jgi:hypothetical protein
VAIELLKDPGIWDRFKETSPYGSIFHQWDVCRIVEKHTGFRFLPYGITRGDDLIAIIPLFSRRVHGIRMVTSPPPRTGIPRMGLLVSGAFDSLRQYRKEEYLEIMGSSLEEELQNLAPDHFFMSLPLHFHDTRIFRWLGYTAVPRYTYVYDLSCSLDQLWENLKGNKRTRIRNAQQAGFTLRKGGGLADFYGLMEIRAREIGHPLALPGREYLADLLHSLPGAFRIYDVCHEGRVVGSAMATLDRDMKMWLGAPKTVPNANDFLQWSLISEAKEMNFRTVEDVGANTRHLVQFKNQFNPSLALYFAVMQKNLQGEVAETVYGVMRRIGTGHLGRIHGRHRPREEKEEENRV